MIKIILDTISLKHILKFKKQTKKFRTPFNIPLINDIDPEYNLGMITYLVLNT